MNPPANTDHHMMMSAPQPMGFGGGHVEDDLCDLCFEELRELPMRMQLGMDLSALD